MNITPRHRSFALALLTALLPAIARAQKPVQPVVWSLAELRLAPTLTAQTTLETGVKAAYYAGPSFRGKPTQTFAYYGLPTGQPPAGGWPGVVLLHGGGGTASADWVRRWNAAGFAAIAMDLEGREPEAGAPAKRKATPQPGPAQAGVFGDASQQVIDQFPYHAVAQAILANSLLRTFPEINHDKIGLCGISWGSIWTCIAAGVDDRFAFAVPIYGHGFLDRNDGQVRINAAQQPAALPWDPALYLPGVKCPMLFVASTNDKFFSIKPWQLTVDLPKGTVQELLLPGLSHSQEAGAALSEPYAFARAAVQGKLSPTPILAGGGVHLAEAPSKAEYCYTLDAGPWVDRLWRSIPANIEGQMVIAPRLTSPVPTTASYYLLTRADGTRISTPVNISNDSVTAVKAPSAPTGAAARVLFKDDFETATAGPLSNFNGWTAKGVGAEVVNDSVHGNALTLAAPFTELARAIPEAADTSAVFVRFAVKATPPAGGGAQASEQLLVYLRDANDKQLCLMWHAGTGQWGINTNGAYNNRSLPGAKDAWTQVEIALDTQLKKVSVKLTNGNTEITLFNNVNFTNFAAGTLAKIAFVRTKDGNDQKVGLDNFAVVVPADAK